MFQDKSAQAIIKFAFEQEYPLQALKTLMRAGKIAELYSGLTDDFDEIFSFVDTKHPPSGPGMCDRRQAENERS